MHPLCSELERRWNALFAALAGGDDAPPAQRLRAEGMMEAAVLLDAASAEELQARMDDCYRAAFGRAIADDFGTGWRQFFPFPQIPAMMRRAPVYPTTAE